MLDEGVVSTNGVTTRMRVSKCKVQFETISRGWQWSSIHECVDFVAHLQQPQGNLKGSILKFKVDKIVEDARLDVLEPNGDSEGSARILVPRL